MGLNIIVYRVGEPKTYEGFGEKSQWVDRLESIPFDSGRQDVDKELPVSLEWEYHPFDEYLSRPADFGKAIQWVKDNASNPKRYLDVFELMERDENVWFLFSY